MPTMEKLAQGARVRFTAGPLGLIEHPDEDFKFAPETVQAGDEGEYHSPNPNPRLPDWHLIAVEVAGRTLYAPVHAHQFEAIP